MNMSQDRPIRDLFGVGPAKEKQLAKLGVNTIKELLYLFPRRYENRGDIVTLADAYMLNQSTGVDSKRAVILTVIEAPKLEFIRKGLDLFKFKARDDSGVCEITLFNQRYRMASFPVGSVFRFWGVVSSFRETFTMTSPDFEPAMNVEKLESFLSIYPLVSGLSQPFMRTICKRALEYADEVLGEDPLPESIREEYGLCPLDKAIRQIHWPHREEEIQSAQYRLSFDELLYYMLGVSMTRQLRRKETAPVCGRADLSALTDLLPYHLTNGQASAVRDVIRDMNSAVPMNRILVGDVGCGKTICAIAAIWVAVQNGRQAALMAPTEILAKQHFRDVSDILEKLGCRCALLTGSTTAAQKKQIYERLSSSDPARRLHVVIGTQALLSEQVEFASPGLVVTDEQHRFGVRQRAVLASKNEHFHLLVMSATPIPRSLALILYGDLAISKIDEMPPGRQRVDTYVVDDSYHQRVINFILKNVQSGGQVYVVCPAVESDGEGNDIDLVETGGNQLKSVKEYSKQLAGELQGVSVAYVHGKMKNAEKEKVMDDFSSGKTQVLVSTTVIEVGVNVPNASLMIVENAERFGLSQLHQLRGRVGRGSRKSYCLLVSNASRKKGSTAYQRLESMRTKYDGFAIAEEDLKLRGPGDFLSLSGSGNIRQSGNSAFKASAFTTDAGLLTKVREISEKILTQSETLEAYPTLKSNVESLFYIQRDTIN